MMKKEITNAEVPALIQAIDDLPKTEAKFSGKLLFAFSKNRGKLNSVMKHIESARVKLIEQYGKEDKERQGKAIDPEDKKAFSKFQEEYGTVLSEKSEVEFHTVKLEEFEKSGEIKPFDNMHLVFEYIIEE